MRQYHINCLGPNTGTIQCYGFCNQCFLTFCWGHASTFAGLQEAQSRDLQQVLPQAYMLSDPTAPSVIAPAPADPSLGLTAAAATVNGLLQPTIPTVGSGLIAPAPAGLSTTALPSALPAAVPTALPTAPLLPAAALPTAAALPAGKLVSHPRSLQP